MNKNKKKLLSIILIIALMLGLPMNNLRAESLIEYQKTNNARLVILDNDAYDLNAVYNPPITSDPIIHEGGPGGWTGYKEGIDSKVGNYYRGYVYISKSTLDLYISRAIKAISIAGVLITKSMLSKAFSILGITLDDSVKAKGGIWLEYRREYNLMRQVYELKIIDSGFQ